MSDQPVVKDYQPPASWASDWQVLKSMMLADVKGDTQQERLESFYESQADLYDSSRCRMLHGRLPMAQHMPAPKNGVWVDLGGGTGSNLEFFGKDGLKHWKKCYVLDFCPSLVETAKKRVKNNGWEELVTVILGDACDHQCAELPEAGTVDVVTFSYALTMIPDWQEAVRNAWRLLKPGGSIAVCDFTVCDDQWPGMSAVWKVSVDIFHIHCTTYESRFKHSFFTRPVPDGGVICLVSNPQSHTTRTLAASGSSPTTTSSCEKSTCKYLTRLSTRPTSMSASVHSPTCQVSCRLLITTLSARRTPLSAQSRHMCKTTACLGASIW